MPLTSFSSGTTVKSADVNSNFALCVLTDTARTITVTHTWTAAQTFTGGWTAAAACTISTGGLTVTAGGVTITAGGVQFPAVQSASADANNLDDYEEGSWTPADGSGAALTFTTPAGTYEKIGRLVIARCFLVYPATADGSNAVVSGLPFTVSNAEEDRQGMITYTTETTLVRAFPAKNATTVGMQNSAGAAITNATLSGDQVYFTAIYHV